MPATAQQDAATPEIHGRPSECARSRAAAPAPRRRSLPVALILAWALCPACDCHPPRSKPWRHAADAAVVPSQDLFKSELLAAESARLEALRRRDHTLRIHTESRPRHLNPMAAPTEWTLRIVQDTVFETLLRYEPPEGGAGSGPGRYEPGLARSWHVSPNGREISIELRPDVHFHDGRKLSVVDVQFSLDAARHPRSETPQLRAHLADVMAVELVTSRALRIRLSKPNGYVLRALADVPILSEEVYRRNLRPVRGPVIGTGPYKLATWSDSLIRLERFADYWGEAPAIPGIEFAYEPDAARALTAAKRNELDLVPALIADHHPEQPSAPGLARNFVPIRLRPNSFRYLALDVREPPLDDVRVRHAIALLLDRKALVKKLHDGLARPVAGPVWPGGPGDGASPAPPEHDPGEAGRLLDAAGWRDTDGDGRRERDGERLAVDLLALDKKDQERQVIVDSLRRAGFFVEIRRGGSAVLMNRLRSGDFGLAVLDWHGTVDQSLAALLETGGALNFGGFSDKRVDRRIAALRGVWEPPSRTPLMAELAAAVAASWPLVPLVAPDPYGLVHKRVRGVVVWDGWISLRRLSLEQTAE